MGNRDRPGRDPKKAKKKDPRAARTLTSAALAQPMPLPELVRKKKREDFEVLER